MANYGDDMNSMKPFFQSFSRIGRKWIFKPFGQNENGRKQFNFTVVSYNILADQLLHEHPWLYSSSQYDSWVYDWNYRKKNLLEEILFTRADVSSVPTSIYLFKVNNSNIRKRCEICSKLTIKTPERRQCRRSGVFIFNFERISHLFLVFLLLTLNK